MFTFPRETVCTREYVSILQRLLILRDIARGRFE